MIRIAGVLLTAHRKACPRLFYEDLVVVEILAGSGRPNYVALSRSPGSRGDFDRAVDGQHFNAGSGRELIALMKLVLLWKVRVSVYVECVVGSAGRVTAF